MENDFLKISFQTFMCFFVTRKLVNRKHFVVKEKFILVSGKYFPFILGGKDFSEVVKNLEMPCYLLIISNLVLKLLIAIFFLQFHFLEFDLI
jgi:hypothetical protein